MIKSRWDRHCQHFYAFERILCLCGTAGAGSVIDMRFLIRLAFGLGLLFLIIPFEKDGPAPAESASKPVPAEPVGSLQLFSAASEAMRDIAGICDRRPDVCVTAKAMFATLAAHAAEILHSAPAPADQGSRHPVPDTPIPAGQGKKAGSEISP